MEMNPSHILVFCCLFGLSSGNIWCGYQPEWNRSHSTIPFLSISQENVVATTPMDKTKFRAPVAGFYTVTVTAVVGGMLPSKPGDLLMNTSPVYAQIFLKHNGVLRLDGSTGEKRIEETNYLLVREGHVGDLTSSVYLGQGDTLELYAGHVTSTKFSREAYNHKTMRLPGGYLEDVSFCVISHL